MESSLVALLFAALAIGGVWWGLGISMPELASRHGAGIDRMLNYLLVTVGALFLAGYLALAYLIWRGARRDHIGPRFASRRTELLLSGALGLGMALIAEGGVLAIGIPVWAEYFDAAPSPDAISIEVTAQQFMWNVRYPGADKTFGRTETRLIDETANPLGVDRTDPAGKDDLLTINEITVPGMSPEVMFVPTRTGHFELACAELCGLAHYRMRGFFNVVAQQEFDEWLRAQGEQP